MKIILAQDKLIGDKQHYTGDEIEVSDTDGTYMISMGTASAISKPEEKPSSSGFVLKKKASIDKLDEAVDKDNPFHLGGGEIGINPSRLAAETEGNDGPAVSKKAKK